MSMYPEERSPFQNRPIQSYSSRKRGWLHKIPKLPNLKKPNGKWDWKNILIWAGMGIIGLVITGIVCLILLIIIACIGLPSIHDLDKLGLAQSTTLYDREGNVLYVKHGGENRTYVAYEAISEDIINATVAIEDDSYWTHQGFDLFSIGRAVVGQVTHNSRGGGSTITQQYVKNAFLSPEKSYMRKLKELILSVQLESAYDKKKIMELYLNKIPYGNNAYGIEKAAQIYFGKKASEITLAQASILASIPNAPTRYNPYGEYRNSKLLKQFTPQELSSRKIQSETDLREDEYVRGLLGQNVPLAEGKSVYLQGRTDLVLKAMERLGYITESERNAALKELQAIVMEKHLEDTQGLHFIFHILEQLEEKYGQEIVEQGGLRVYTTLDPKLQDAAETAVQEQAKINTETYNAKNAALVSIDPKTGEILAMVGSKGYGAEDIDGAVNITTSYRQPGSSFKPFVYAQAFVNRYSPGTVVFDTEVSFGDGTSIKNYDGKYRGLMSLRSALGQSRNIPAMKTFFMAGGQEPIMSLAGKMGIRFTERDKTVEHSWTLALGTAVVRPLDMASAFGTFANGGVHHEPVSILKIETAAGEILEEWKPDQGTEALDPKVAYLINNILSDKSVGIGENLNIPGQTTAAKTGTSTTSDDNHLPQDLWTVGYSTDVSTAVWAGNNRPEEDKLTANADGYNAAAKIWKQFMTQALQQIPSKPFPAPQGITKVTISKLTGKLAGPETPEHLKTEEVFADFAVPEETDASGVTVTIDTRNGKLANEYCPTEFTKATQFLMIHDVLPNPRWEEGVLKWTESEAGQEWIKGNIGLTNSGVTIGTPPTETSDLCSQGRENEKPEIEIIWPEKNEQVEKGSNIKVQAKVQSGNSVEKVEFYLDDRIQYTAKNAPWNGTIRLPKGETGENRHTITVKAIDIWGYAGEETVTIFSIDNPQDNNEENNAEAESESDASSSSNSASSNPEATSDAQETISLPSLPTSDLPTL